MTRLGDELRRERQRRNLSLEALSAETKVNLRHLAALEEGDYKELPGGVFRRGIVRAYLRATGLDESPWLDRFQQSFTDWAKANGVEPEPGGEAWAEFAENVRRNRATTATGSGIRWLGVLFMIALLGAAAWAVWHFILHDRLPR